MIIPWEAIITVLIYIIASTIGFVWWMATITVTMQFMKESLQKMTDQNALYVTKPEMTEKIAPLTISLNKAWDKIDTLMVRNGTVDK